MTSESARFLNAFIEIEQALKTILGTNKHQPFYQLVNAAARKDPFVRDISVELKEYGDLRNAIVHERIDDQPIAEPHHKVVRRLEKIRDLLTKPPKVADQFLGPVITCCPGDSIGTVAQEMYKHGFSKIPVYDGEKFLGLLTAEAITHWLGNQFMMKGKALAEETVQAVLNYVGNQHDYYFVGPDCPLFKIISVFEDFSHQGQRLQAILITEDGTSASKPLGIITVFELPEIYGILES